MENRNWNRTGETCSVQQSTVIWKKGGEWGDRRSKWYKIIQDSQIWKAEQKIARELNPG